MRGAITVKKQSPYWTHMTLCGLKVLTDPLTQKKKNFMQPTNNYVIVIHYLCSYKVPRDTNSDTLLLIYKKKHEKAYYMAWDYSSMVLVRNKCLVLSYIYYVCF